MADKIIHECDVLKKLQDAVNPFMHSTKTANLRRPSDFGSAFKPTFVNFGDHPEIFWTDNDEYTSPILFCPGCGIKLSTLLKKKKT